MRSSTTRCCLARQNGRPPMDKPEHLCPAFPDQPVVLLAEDDVMVRNVARRVLEAEGYCILTAAHGEEALKISEKYPGPIHLLLSDVRMPVMDGLRLKEQVVTRRPEIKVLLMSGEAPSPIDV